MLPVAIGTFSPSPSAPSSVSASTVQNHVERGMAKLRRMLGVLCDD